jgi:cobalt-zinc-cadmium efflux system membrane fusion protein
MSNESGPASLRPRKTLGRVRPSHALLLLVAVAIGVSFLGFNTSGSALNKVDPKADLETPRVAKKRAGVFHPTEAQLAGLTIEPVGKHPFRSELVTDGKIAVDENRSTPVFSPYSGRVTRIVAEPGDVIERGQLLFALEATDMVQAQNDFITALSGVETARSQLKLAQINEKRQHDLYDAKAVPLKDWQLAQNELIVQQDNMRTAEIAVEAVRNRLRILAKSDEELLAFEKTGRINPETPIHSPIAGTVVTRKVGPGQYITAGASDPAGDPVFVVGDLSTVWLVANVRETDALTIRPGQSVEFRVLAAPARAFAAKVKYVATAMDPATRRLLVRATLENPDRLLKPEMFASVTIFTSDHDLSPAVPREAVIYDGNTARLWIAADDKTLELRRFQPGLTAGNLVQVVSGVQAGEKIVTRGGVFIDRAAAGGES